METVIIVVHLIIVLALIGVVLLQRSEGGLGLGGGGGVSGFMTGRGQANALTRATAILAALFFLTSLVLTVLASYGRAPRSILEGATPGQTSPAGQPAPAGQGPGVLEQLQRMQGEQPAAPSGGAATPATPQVPQSQ
jgi:preprotein translocase subunit SecG